MKLCWLHELIKIKFTNTKKSLKLSTKQNVNISQKQNDKGI